MGYLINKVSTALWTFFYYAFGWMFNIKLGSGCRFEGMLEIPQRGGAIILGDRVHMCRRITLTVSSQAVLLVGNDSFLGSGVVVSSHARVSIGSDCLIAEYVSIYDNDHRASDISKPISLQGYITEPCKIADGCWVGAGAKVLRGAGLGNNSILGAGAVLKDVLPANSIAVGVPAKVVKFRA